MCFVEENTLGVFANAVCPGDTEVMSRRPSVQHPRVRYRLLRQMLPYRALSVLPSVCLSATFVHSAKAVEQNEAHVV